MSLKDEIRALPLSLWEGSARHIGNHRVIHAALQQHDTDIDAAVGVAGEAEARANVAISTVGSMDTRVSGVEAMAGITPESPVDGQTANLITQPGTLTRAALAAAFQEDPPGSGLYTITTAAGE